MKDRKMTDEINQRPTNRTRKRGTRFPG